MELFEYRVGGERTWNEVVTRTADTHRRCTPRVAICDARLFPRMDGTTLHDTVMGIYSVQK